MYSHHSSRSSAWTRTSNWRPRSCRLWQDCSISGTNLPTYHPNCCCFSMKTTSGSSRRWRKWSVGWRRTLMRARCGCKTYKIRNIWIPWTKLEIIFSCSRNWCSPKATSMIMVNFIRLPPRMTILSSRTSILSGRISCDTWRSISSAWIWSKIRCSWWTKRPTPNAWLS